MLVMWSEYGDCSHSSKGCKPQHCMARYCSASVGAYKVHTRTCTNKHSSDSLMFQLEFAQPTALGTTGQTQVPPAALLGGQANMENQSCEVYCPVWNPPVSQASRHSTYMSPPNSVRCRKACRTTDLLAILDLHWPATLMNPTPRT